jgi:hypothetical protein
MTNLTIELPPPLYERLRQEAERQGKPAQEIAETWLAERLQESTSATPLYLDLAPEVRELLAQMSPGELLVPPQGTPEDAIRLLQSWNEEDAAGEEEEGESWDDVLRSLDANRGSYRRLFPELDQQS